MQTISQQLSVGRRDRNLDLFVTYGVEGEPKTRMKCDSFLASYASDIYGAFSGGKGTFVGKHQVHFGDEIDFNFYGDYNGEAQLRLDYNVTTNHRSFLQDRQTDGAPFTVMVENFGSYWPDGTYQAEVVGWIDTSYEDGRALLHIIGLPIWNGSDYTAYGNVYLYKENTEASYQFYNLHPYIGTATGNVIASDGSLETRLAHLSESGTSYSTVTTDQQSSVLTISRSFTNNSGGDISISEVGLYNGYFKCAARDILGSTLLLPNTKTFTLDYEVRLDIDNFTQDTLTGGSNGGFTAEFLEGLRERLVTSSSSSYWQLFCFFGSGMMQPPSLRFSDGYYGYHFGIRLGRNEKFVSMTDTQLNPDSDPTKPIIEQGNGNGQLHHGAMAITSLEVDDQAGTVSFRIAREFENTGSIPVTVKEYGIYANRQNTSSATDLDDCRFAPTLIARTALAEADQFTFQPGDRKKIEYLITFLV